MLPHDHHSTNAHERGPGRRPVARERAEAAAVDCLERFSLLIGAELGFVSLHVPEDDKAALQLCIRDYVRALRSMRLEPEQVIAAVKATVRSGIHTIDGVEPVTQLVVPWAIKAYYDP